MHPLLLQQLTEQQPPYRCLRQHLNNLRLHLHSSHLELQSQMATTTPSIHHLDCYLSLANSNSQSSWEGGLCLLRDFNPFFTAKNANTTATKSGNEMLNATSQRSPQVRNGTGVFDFEPFANQSTKAAGLVE